MASIGMPLHLRLKTREHYCTLLDAHLLREVRRWFPRRGDPAAPAARAGRTSLEGRGPEGDSVLFAPWTRGGAVAIQVTSDAQYTAPDIDL